MDTRNILAFPKALRVRLRGSNVINLAYIGNLIMPVDDSTILRHAYPCCQQGGPCCPRGLGGCCSHWRVDVWVKHVVRFGGADLQYHARRRWYDQSDGLSGVFLPRERRAFRRNLLRPLNMSGLSNFHLV